MAIVDTVGGGGIYSNILGISVGNAVTKLPAPIVWLQTASWNNTMPLIVMVAGDASGKALAMPAVVEVAADGAFKNIIASAQTNGPSVNLGKMPSMNIFVRARYAGTA